MADHQHPAVRSAGNEDERDYAKLLALAALGFAPPPKKISMWKRLCTAAENIGLVLLALILLPVSILTAPFAFLLRKPVPWLAGACGTCWMFAAWTLINACSVKKSRPV